MASRDFYRTPVTIFTDGLKFKDGVGFATENGRVHEIHSRLDLYEDGLKLIED